VKKTVLTALLLVGLLAGCGVEPDAPAATPVQYRELPPTLRFDDRTPLARLNELRALAAVPAVPENSALSAACLQHASWILRNGVLQHGEAPATPGYTVQGDRAGQQSNLSASQDPDTSMTAHIDSIMVAPFHGLGFIDPLVRGFGLGYLRDPHSLTPLRSASVVDVIGDRATSLPEGVSYPILWPAPGQTLPFTGFDGLEYPNPVPLAKPPFGCPLIVQTGRFDKAPRVTSWTLLRDDGEPLSCFEIDETTYLNSNSQEQALGRSVLRGRNAIILIPRSPLVPGRSYTASLINHGELIRWSFNVSPSGYIPER